MSNYSNYTNLLLDIFEREFKASLNAAAKGKPVEPRRECHAVVGWDLLVKVPLNR